MVKPSYTFGPFVFDRIGYRVLRGRDQLDLTPKLLDLLLFLLQRPAELVTKEELLDALWPDANVTENALAQAVSELRQALGDDASHPQFIKTISRRGYRFVAAVEPVVSERAAPRRDDARSDPAEATPAASETTTGAGPAAPVHDANTIAVLDFANVSGDPSVAWLASGIAETVTGDLRALGHLKVVDRWRVMEASHRTDGSLQQVTADLRARFAVVGSYQLNGDRLRITARVVDVVSGEALADAKVDGPLDGIFELQDQIVARLSKELGVPVRPRTTGQGGGHETRSLEAYRAFTEGWLRLESLDITEMARASEDFERAVSLDRHYALAYTGLASAEFVIYETTRSENAPDRERLDRAIAHARHAVRLDEALAEAHATLALLLVDASKPSEAVGSARRAAALEPSNWRHLFRLGYASWGDARLRAIEATLALHPDFAFAYFQAAMVHVARNHLPLAEATLRQGAAVQDRQIQRRERFPALGLHWLLGLVRLAQDDVDEALAEFERELQLADPRRLYGREYAMNAWHARSLTLLRASRGGEAREALQRALELYPNHVQSLIALGEFARADAAIAILETRRPIEAAMASAQLQAARGHATDAVESLGRLVADAPPGFAGWTIPIEPLLRQLADTKGFARVIDRLAHRAV